MVLVRMRLVSLALPVFLRDLLSAAGRTYWVHITVTIRSLSLLRDSLEALETIPASMHGRDGIQGACLDARGSVNAAVTMCLNGCTRG